MNMLRNISSLLLILLYGLGSSGLALAQTKSNPSAPRSLAEAAAQQSSGQTDIIARVDSPRVTNILPWQEQPLSTPKNPLSISALDGSLIPTDRDRLASETQYTKLLSQPFSNTPTSNRP
ncbi:MAG: hypothetical protein VXW65_05135 [Pseudomonadota bacterium]|nr:hypothetical protein [Pseudomonadota bacterium]